MHAHAATGPGAQHPAALYRSDMLGARVSCRSIPNRTGPWAMESRGSARQPPPAPFRTSGPTPHRLTPSIVPTTPSPVPTLLAPVRMIGVHPAPAPPRHLISPLSSADRGHMGHLRHVWLSVADHNRRFFTVDPGDLLGLAFAARAALGAPPAGPRGRWTLSAALAISKRPSSLSCLFAFSLACCRPAVGGGHPDPDHPRIDTACSAALPCCPAQL